jgi:hypothetical protein
VISARAAPPESSLPYPSDIPTQSRKNPCQIKEY